MNYFEACKFGELVKKKCNGDNLKLLLGSPVNYLVRPASINNITIVITSATKVIPLFFFICFSPTINILHKF